VKPFQKSDLIPAIEMALGRHEQLVALERENADLAERLEARKLTDRAKGRLMDERAMSDRTRAIPPEERDELASNDRAGCPGRDRRRAQSVSARKLLSSTVTRSRTAPSSRCPPTSRPPRAPSHAVYGFTSMLTKVLAASTPISSRCLRHAQAARSATTWTRVQGRTVGEPDLFSRSCH